MEQILKSEIHPNPRGVLGAAAAKARASRTLPLRRKKDLPESGRVLPEDGSDSSVSSWSRSLIKDNDAVKPVKIAPEGHGEAALPSMRLEPVAVKSRCTWITAYSENLYVSFHDEEWGVPVYDDQRIFELLTLSAALSEFSWPTILSKRDKFRKLLDNFNPAIVAKFTEKKINSLKASGSPISEEKLRAVVGNAKQILKVIEEFGTFSNYIWSFVNHKQIVNEFRHSRQVPMRNPKAELMSNDMMRRGFRCVGPTIIYSFMQAAGIVNDHLSSCFRFRDCSIMFQPV